MNSKNSIHEDIIIIESGYLLMIMGYGVMTLIMVVVVFVVVVVGYLSTWGHQ